MAGTDTNNGEPVSIQSSDSAPRRSIPSLKSEPPPPNHRVRAYCDVANGAAFSADYGEPPLPILFAFGGGPLHQYTVERECDLQRATEQNAEALFRSSHYYLPLMEPAGRWHEVLFRFSSASFLHADSERATGYAASAAEAARLTDEFVKTYALPPKPSNTGSFHLIRIGEEREITTEAVYLEPKGRLSENVLDLHFGAGFGEWDQRFSDKLLNSNYGLTIFEGPPGTGKTTYLRHLLAALNETHRFYFIPTASMSVLSDCKFIGFWSSQRREYPKRKFAVVIEDAEAALWSRESDNREQVSAILNLSDGMLADFLRLQFICTINCSATKIDPALLRPGRLLCHRFFSRLEYHEASRLAAHLGRKLAAATDYSLAEIYNSESWVSGNGGARPIGFVG